ncbi:MAG: DUF3467 domain-containing protein [Actinobacteria bacterium]|nr:DUF3467 domain-containing protein [Actinomycetota bacterium]
MPEQQFVLSIPDELEAGAYANVANVWHSPYEFTIDFGVTGQPALSDDGSVTVPVRVTSRVRLPVSVVFPLLRALNSNIALFEQQYGPVPTGDDPDLDTPS